MSAGLRYNFIGLGIGAILFWLPFAVIRQISGSDYGPLQVIVLSFSVPATILLALGGIAKKLPEERSALGLAILLGVCGPLISTLVYSTFAVALPALQGSADLNALLPIIVLGPLSVLTYTGMLGVFIVTVVASPLVGLWLSRHSRGEC